MLISLFNCVILENLGFLNTDILTNNIMFVIYEFPTLFLDSLFTHKLTI